MKERTDDDYLAYLRSSGKRIPWDEPVRKAKLYRLITSGCNLRQLAEGLECDQGNIRQLIIRNGFVRIWQENRQRRLNIRRKPKELYPPGRTRAILDEFASRGYRVVQRKTLGACRIEGFPFSIFCPKIPRKIFSDGKMYEYFVVQSQHLNRFIIIELPNGKKIFRWPYYDGTKSIVIPISDLEGPTQWPLKAEFRHQRMLAEPSQSKGLEAPYVPRKGLDNHT